MKYPAVPVSDVGAERLTLWILKGGFGWGAPGIVRPQADSLLSRFGRQLDKKIGVRDIGRIGRDRGISLANQFRIDKGLADIDIAQEPPIPVGLTYILDESISLPSTSLALARVASV